MFHYKNTFVLLGLMLLASACTQPPVPVDYRGGEFFGKEHQGPLGSSNNETYPPDSSRFKSDYTHPSAKASVPAVSVADLAPPGTYRNQPTAAPSASEEKHLPWVSKETAPAKAPASSGSNGQFAWPVAGGKIISHFGPKPGGKANDGINIALAEGEPIWAAADGMVVYAGNELKGYGNMVILRHDGGWMTAYAHARSISVKKNDYVKKGALLAYVGMTGSVKTPQLHFVIRNGKIPVNPEQHLPGGGAE